MSLFAFWFLIIFLCLYGLYDEEGIQERRRIKNIERELKVYKKYLSLDQIKPEVIKKELINDF